MRNFFEDIKEYQTKIQAFFLMVELFVFLYGVINFKPLILCSVFIILVAGLYGLFTFEFLDLKKARKQFHLLGWTVALGSCEMVNSLFMLGLNSVFSNKKVLLLFFLLLDLIIFVLWVPVFFPPKRDTEKRDKIDDFLGESRWGGSDAMKSGDTYLGIDKETGKLNVVPYKDRFLHFLILGPTGSGKTSQSLLPMVYNDMRYKDLGIVCLEPKGDFAEQVYALGKLSGRTDVMYFNPTLADCPYFNPLRGELNDVIESITTAFGSMDGDSKQYFKDMNRILMVSGITVVKTLYGDDATLINLNTLFTNKNECIRMMSEFNKLPFRDGDEKAAREEIFNYFINDYVTGMGGQKNGTNTFQNSSGIRTQLSNLISNGYLRKVLNPPKQSELKPDQYIDFERVLEEGSILAMCSAQGALRDLGKTLGMFLIQSFEAAVFRRPGDENSRKGCIFYVDEFQKYANKGYDDLLTQGRSYRVSSVLATQSRSAIGINSGALGKTLTELVDANARNKVVYPGGSYDDAHYFSTNFGTLHQEKENISISRGRSIFDKWNIGDQRESVSTKSEDVPLFTTTDIQYRPFGEAIAQIVKNNTVQRAKVVKLDFINKDVKKMMDNYIEEEIRPRASKGYIEALNYDPTEQIANDLAYNNATMDLEFKGDFSDEFDDEAL